MVETNATSRSFPGWDAVPEDIIPAEDDTYDLGADDKRWAYIYAAIAVLTSLIIGGIYVGATAEGWLFINASTEINGSLNISEDLFVNGTLTAGSVDITNLTVENMNFTNLTLTGDIFNISATETYVNDLFPNEYCEFDLGSIGLRWDNGYFCHNVSAEYFIGDGSYLTGLPTGDNSSWNETYADGLYYGIDNPFSFWNDTYATFNKTYADTLYLTSFTELDPYWTGNQSSYFNITDILGFSYYNATDFDISDYYSSSDIDSFNYWNDTYATFNKTYADTLYLTSYTETDPSWSGNETNVAFKNEANVFTANQNLTGQNITAIDCIIFDSGGKICSGA